MSRRAISPRRGSLRKFLQRIRSKILLGKTRAALTLVRPGEMLEPTVRPSTELEKALVRYNENKSDRQAWEAAVLATVREGQEWRGVWMGGIPREKLAAARRESHQNVPRIRDTLRMAHQLVTPNALAMRGVVAVSAAAALMAATGRRSR